MIVVGLLWPSLDELALVRLAEDVLIERDDVRAYPPVTTSLLVSLVVSLALRPLGR